MTWKTRVGAERCPIGMTTTERLVVAGIIGALIGVALFAVFGA